jgi:hypothetical protein
MSGHQKRLARRPHLLTSNTTLQISYIAESRKLARQNLVRKQTTEILCGNFCTCCCCICMLEVGTCTHCGPTPDETTVTPVGLPGCWCGTATCCCWTACCGGPAAPVGGWGCACCCCGAAVPSCACCGAFIWTCAKLRQQFVYDAKHTAED